jgi:hypothetical protein
LVDPKQAWAAGSDITLAAFGKDVEGTSVKHIWSYYRGDSTDPINKEGILTLRGGPVKGANLKEIPAPSNDKFILGNIDGKGFPDVSSCEGISLTARSASALQAPVVNGLTGMFEGTFDIEIPEYKDFAFTIGAKANSRFSFGYKAKFSSPKNEFGTVKIPFTDFTKSWDKETGEPISTCKASPENCPTPEILQNLKQMTLVAETPGNYRLEVEKISAYGCKAAASFAERDPFDEAGITSGTSSLWLFAATSSGLFAFLVVKVRSRPVLPITPPLLG